VDGGTNRLYEIRTKNETAQLQLPDLITGDFDSIEPSVKEHYADQGVKIVSTPDQDATDFTKAVLEFSRGQDAGEYPKASAGVETPKRVLNFGCTTNLEILQVDVILVIAESSGRYDQFFANINTLVKLPQEVKIFLISRESISWILRAGCSHKLEFDLEYVNLRPHCGLIPFAGRATLTTKGLRWNLDNTDCFFGGMVSTSNEVAASTVEVTANADLLWTMQNNSLA